MVFSEVVNLTELFDQSTDDVKSAAQLLLTEKTLGQGWVVLVVKTKMAENSAKHFTRLTTNCCLKT